MFSKKDEARPKDPTKWQPRFLLRAETDIANDLFMRSTHAVMDDPISYSELNVAFQTYIITKSYDIEQDEFDALFPKDPVKRMDTIQLLAVRACSKNASSLTAAAFYEKAEKRIKKKQAEDNGEGE